MPQGRSDVLVKGCTFPSTCLTLGSARAPNSPEVSSGLQHHSVQPPVMSHRRHCVLDLGSFLRVAPVLCVGG